MQLLGVLARARADEKPMPAAERLRAGRQGDVVFALAFFAALVLLGQANSSRPNDNDFLAYLTKPQVALNKAKHRAVEVRIQLQEERRPREGADDGAGSVAGPTAGRLRFQPSRSAPNLPHQVPNEHAENAGTRKRRHSEELSALDPLEAKICRLQPSGERRHRPSVTQGWAVSAEGTNALSGLGL
jgi:hypothetical protein